MLRITLKNYRCFTDEQPAVIELNSGFIAFVGPNNSGKSTLLRFFLEFRELLRKVDEPFRHPYGRGISFSIQHVEDWFEIFPNTNNRDLSIMFEHVATVNNSISKFELLIRRDQANSAIIGPIWVKKNTQELIQFDGQTNQMGYLDGNSFIRYESTDIITIIQQFSDTLYIGPFRNINSESTASYFDIQTGTQFVAQWNQWKTGTKLRNSQETQQITDDIAHIFEYDRFEINATDDRRALQVIINGKSHRLRELGAGLSQFIIVFGNVANRRPGWLLIDEPELNLHPSLQVDFLTSLASYTKRGVIFASHSLGLARSVSDRIYSFSKKKNAREVKPYEQTPNFAEFAGLMSFSAFKEIGCEGILLVEGVTEVKAIQQFLRVLRKDHSIVILPLGGSQMIRGEVELELNDLKRLSNKVFVLIDSEKSSRDAPLDSQRQAFTNSCEALNFKICVTQYRAFENYLTDRAVKAEKGGNFGALAHYQKLKESTNAWAKSDNWRIARHMTSEEILATDIGQFLERI